MLTIALSGLKYKELTQSLTQEEQDRWENIKTTFVKNNKLKGLGNTNDMGQTISQLLDFNAHLNGIQKALLGRLE